LRGGLRGNGLEGGKGEKKREWVVLSLGRESEKEKGREGTREREGDKRKERKQGKEETIFLFWDEFRFFSIGLL
jgi:hypothetical protein